MGAGVDGRLEKWGAKCFPWRPGQILSPPHFLEKRPSSGERGAGLLRPGCPLQAGCAAALRGRVCVSRAGPRPPHSLVPKFPVSHVSYFLVLCSSSHTALIVAVFAATGAKNLVPRRSSLPSPHSGAGCVTLWVSSGFTVGDRTHSCSWGHHRPGQ